MTTMDPHRRRVGSMPISGTVEDQEQDEDSSEEPCDVIFLCPFGSPAAKVGVDRVEGRDHQSDDEGIKHIFLL